MKGIITVVGKDSVGIIAKICNVLSENDVNILDISQTIVGGYFNMMMVVDLSKMKCTFHHLAEILETEGEGGGVVVRLQHEGIFNAMHRL